jgi:carbonic anhydrase
MKHTCSTLILHCIDFRFGIAIKQYLEEKNLLGDRDIVAVAGAAKNLASPKLPTDKEFIMRQIEISTSLHGITQIILMNHTDCGAYGGRSAFPSREEEEKTHFEEMRRAMGIIQEQYPTIAITSVLANIEDSGEIHFDTEVQ